LGDSSALLRLDVMHLPGRTATSVRNLFVATLLLALSGLASSGQSACTPTSLSKNEAERLVLNVSDALAAKKIGGKLFLYALEPLGSKESYDFELRSTISLPSAPIDNGLVGYYSVSKRTGRVLNVAFDEENGTALENLQRKLRAKHCVSASMVREERNDE